MSKSLWADWIIYCKATFHELFFVLRCCGCAAFTQWKFYTW